MNRGVESGSHDRRAKAEAYFWLLVESAQSELHSTDHAASLAALKTVHMREYARVVATVAAPGITHLERNRRTNFARAVYARLRRWLRSDPENSLFTLGVWADDIPGLYAMWGQAGDIAKAAISKAQKPS